MAPTAGARRIARPSIYLGWTVEWRDLRWAHYRPLGSFVPLTLYLIVTIGCRPKLWGLTSNDRHWAGSFAIGVLSPCCMLI